MVYLQVKKAHGLAFNPENFSVNAIFKLFKSFNDIYLKHFVFQLSPQIKELNEIEVLVYLFILYSLILHNRKSIIDLSLRCCNYKHTIHSRTEKSLNT